MQGSKLAAIVGRLRGWDSVLGMILLFAFALRLARLDAQSLWVDEAYSITVAGGGLSEAVLRDPGHPPLYHVVLHFWLQLAGNSEFAARFLSVGLGWLMVPLAYRLAARLFDRETGLVAAALTGVSPVLLWYSQEARMYALLALEILALLYIFHRLWDPGPGTTTLSGWWAALVGAEVAALYTHYLAAVVIAYLTAVALIGAAIERRWGFGVWWTGAQLLVGLAYLPWLPVALPRVAAYRREVATPLTLSDFAAQVWHGYNAGALRLVGHHQLFTRLSTVAAFALLAGLMLLAWRDPARRRLTMLLAHSLVPLGLIFLVMQWRPGFHPRYVVMLAAPLLIVTARAIRWAGAGAGFRSWRWGAPTRLGAAVIGLIFLATFAVSIQAVATDPDYQRDDVRGLSAYLATVARAQDLILFDRVDYAFRYYYRGSAPVRYLVSQGDDQTVLSRLQTATAGKERVWFVQWEQANTDKRRLIPFLLELAGRQVATHRFRGLRLRAFDLERPVALPALRDSRADFGPVQLTGAFVEPAVPADEAVTLALRWRLVQPTDRDFKVTLVVEDGRGRRIDQTDRLLLDNAGHPTSRWASLEESVNYYRINLPAGTAPLAYPLLVGVYDAASLNDLVLTTGGTRFPLGTVSLSRARTPPVERPKGFAPLEIEVADGLLLEGYVGPVSGAVPGESVSMTLYWRALRAGLPDYRPRLRLLQGDSVLAESAGAPVDGRYPTDRWASGEVVLDRRDLPVPPDAPPGSATLVVDTANGPIPLTTFPIAAPERVFTAPLMQHRMSATFLGVGELIGYDVDRTRVRADERLRLTLYWRAVNERPIPTPYTVFTHLLDSTGRLIAQHDGPPAGGRRPTTGWVRGEIITDVHELAFSASDYTGEALLEVGLYDLATGRRVPLALAPPPVGQEQAGASGVERAGNLTGAEDRVVLPTRIEVTP